ncbi:TerB family tellurite resistance protein [Isoalcanivorax beigongshangi]|uniref:TerB family tellurite resistance protein n=1 Tax=Isoalcanivorax beigongshangi TaxID=3238810 RepID=A0ABV4AH02_9GAMM
MSGWKALGRWLSGPEQAPAPALEDAAAALLYEVARADGVLSDSEQQALSTRLVQLFGEPAASAAQRGAELAEQEVDYFRLVQVLRDHWSAEQRAELVDAMWQIAAADGELSRDEEAVVRKVADLLYVSHSRMLRGRPRQGTQ